MGTSAPGRLLGGRYRLREPIGSGGMGTVWHGTDEVLGRDVAIKEVVYPPEVPESERATLRERTLREARAVARITHPSVVTVYDVVREDERPWIVMEMVTGRSLADRLAQEGPVSPPRAAEIGLDLLAAVERAHTAGVLHRDIKPANVLLADDGRVVLTDFGIASVEGDPSLTSTGLLLGSPAYMAPERARSQPPGPAADLWGVGATLYAAVEGRPPYERPGPLPTVTALVTEPPDPPHVTGPIRAALDALLVKDPAQRAGVPNARALLQRVAPAEQQHEPAATPAAGTGGEQERQDPVAEVAGSQPPAPTTGATVAGRSRRRAVLTGLVAALAALTLVAFALAAQSGPDDGRPTDRQATGSPAPTARSTPSPSDQRSGSRQEVPPGFRMHRDPTGFSVAVPNGWRRVREGSNVDFREPGGGRFLRIGQSRHPKPDPVADWKGQEQSFEARYPGYRRVRIEPVAYRDYNAADWEFTFPTSGGRLHVLNRAAVTSEDRAYAIYWSTPVERWQDSRSYFEVFARTFRPAP